MKVLRLSLIALSVVLLGAGYFASQAAYLQGLGPVEARNFASQYAIRVDQPTIAGLALALLVAAVALAAIPDKEEESSGS